MPYHFQKTPKLTPTQRNMPFQLCIKEFLLSKGVDKPYAWLRKAGISHSVCHKMLTGKQDRMRISQLGKICEKGFCTPNDLFVWIPSSPTADIASHPLQKLKPRVLKSLKQDLEKLSPERIAEVQAYIKTLNEKPLDE